MTILSRISQIVGKLFALSVLVLAFNTSFAQEKSASLVLKESFGSDPYQNVAYNDGTLVVTGRPDVGGGIGSPNIDILQYDENGFTLLSQFHLPKEINDNVYIKATDIEFQNGYWVVLVLGSPKQYLLTATVENGTLTIVNKLEVDIPNDNSSLVTGADNNIYLVSSENALAVTHFTIDDMGSITANNKVSFGIAPNEPSYRDYFSVAYDNNTLYLTSNQEEESAAFYKLPLGDDGEPLEAVRLTFNNANSKYHTAAVAGDLWFLSYHLFGFQVAQIENDELTVIYEHSESSRYGDFKVKGNLVIGVDTFGEIDVFEIGEDNAITLKSSLGIDGFSNGAVLAQNKLFYTQDYKGISVAEVSESGTLTFLDNFNQSGEITDFAMQGEELAIAAFDTNLHFWTLDDSAPATLTATYSTGNGIQGVEWQGDKVVISESAQFETHIVGNMKKNVNVGLRYDNLGIGGRDGQIVRLENGYLVQAFERVNFIDENNLLASSIDFDSSDQFNHIQEIVAEGNLAFVPLLNPAEIVIYDTSDLFDVVELSRISRRSILRGNTAVRGNYLYVPAYVGNGVIGITPYDISDPSAPIELLSVRAGEGGSKATLHIDGDYLIIVGETGALFDISEPATPVLIDENLDVSSKGIGAGYGKDLFTVAKHSAGYVHRSQINLAPTHPDVSISLQEDGRASLLLTPTDSENDAVSYEVIDMPTKGTISFDGENNLLFESVTDLNGADEANLLVVDPHGGASQFKVTIDITPVNDFPIISTDIVNAIEDTTANTAIVASDVESENLTFHIKRQAEHGRAEINNVGAFTYLSEQDFFGDDSIEIEVADEHGGITSKEVTIYVSPENDLPEFNGETSQAGDEDSTITFNLSAFDVEGDEVAYEIVTLPNEWSGTINDSVLEITPKENDNGNFDILIAVLDGVGSVDQTLSVSLTAVNDAPTLGEQSANVSVTSGKSRIISLNATDVDGDTLIFEVVEAATLGTASVNQQGEVTYLANANVTGADSFVVGVSDGQGGSVSKTINVNISAPPAPSNSSNSGGGGSINWLALAMLLLIAKRRNFQKI